MWQGSREEGEKEGLGFDLGGSTKVKKRECFIYFGWWAFVWAEGVGMDGLW